MCRTIAPPTSKHRLNNSMVMPSLPASRELPIARRAEFSWGNVTGWTLKVELYTTGGVHHTPPQRLKRVAMARTYLLSHATTDISEVGRSQSLHASASKTVSD